MSFSCVWLLPVAPEIDVHCPVCPPLRRLLLCVVIDQTLRVSCEAAPLMWW